MEFEDNSPVVINQGPTRPLYTEEQYQVLYQALLETRTTNDRLNRELDMYKNRVDRLQKIVNGIISELEEEIDYERYY